jgi:hypothetical protein
LEKWCFFKVEIHFEITNEGKNDSIKDGIVLYGMKLVGSMFDPSTSSILPSE